MGQNKASDVLLRGRGRENIIVGKASVHVTAN